MITIPCDTKILREFNFADWRFFCVLRELIFAIRTNWFFFWELFFSIFRKYPVPRENDLLVPSIDIIFVFIKYMQ